MRHSMRLRTGQRAPAPRTRRTLIWTAVATLVVAALPADRGAAVPWQPEEPGGVESLGEVQPHWVWVTDRLFEHSVLYDGDTAQVLGTIDAGIVITPKPPLWSRSRGEFYSVDTAYSRGRRGERSDFVTIYGDRTLAVTGEIMLPRHTAETGTAIAIVGLLDGDRFLLVYSQFPVSTVTVVDLERRRAVESVVVTGCAGVFPAGDRRFGTLCGDGTLLSVDLREDGTLAGRKASKAFFDPVQDPVFLSAARDGTRWLFASYGGRLHTVDLAAPAPRVEASWDLVSGAERTETWRLGGAQRLALHRGTGRLFSLWHQGGPGSHKDAGSEIWVHDIRTHERIARIPAPNTLSAFLRPQLGVQPGGLIHMAMNRLLPNQGIHSLVVTQDPAPLLFVRNSDLGAVAVLDALTGEHLRDLEEAGVSGVLMEVP